MRREGYVPSVVYGGGTENLNVKVNAKKFGDMLAHSASENILVTLELEGGASQLAFLKDVQHDALSGQMLHADFLAVSETTEITASIPVELTGDSPGVAEGGVLEQLIHDLEIRCLPKDLPEVIPVDISALEMRSALHVGEVTWPDGVVPTIGDDVVLAVVGKARVAEEEELEGAEGIEGEEGAEAAEGGEEEKKED